MEAERTREQRVRRKLSRNGYHLCKTPSRSSQRERLGVGFIIVHDATNCLVFGGEPWRYSATLENVESWAAKL